MAAWPVELSVTGTVVEFDTRSTFKVSFDVTFWPELAMLVELDSFMTEFVSFEA